jgi:hypothetical protein
LERGTRKRTRTHEQRQRLRDRDSETERKKERGADVGALMHKNRTRQRGSDLYADEDVGGATSAELQEFIKSRQREGVALEQAVAESAYMQPKRQRDRERARAREREAQPPEDVGSPELFPEPEVEDLEDLLDELGYSHAELVESVQELSSWGDVLVDERTFLTTVQVGWSSVSLVCLCPLLLPVI